MKRRVPTEELLPIEVLQAREPAPPPCPVDRMPRRRRNRICIRIIAVGALNFLVYTLLYAALGGDAHNGERQVIREAGSAHAVYYVRGHFLRSATGQERQVSEQVWIYSYVHSISVLLTSGAMIISMLVLARPHIIATMRNGFISGETFVTAFGTIALLLTSGAAILFIWDFAAQMSAH